MHPRPELVALVREVYPLVLYRRDARVPYLALAHARLLAWAQVRSRGRSRARRWFQMAPTDWADMALRVMLEYERRG